MCLSLIDVIISPEDEVNMSISLQNRRISARDRDRAKCDTRMWSATTYTKSESNFMLVARVSRFTVPPVQQAIPPVQQAICPPEASKFFPYNLRSCRQELTYLAGKEA